MSLDKKYIEHFVNVSSKAALASSYLVGKKDKIAADQAAVDAMRIELNKIDMSGTTKDEVMSELVKCTSLTNVELIDE